MVGIDKENYDFCKTHPVKHNFETMLIPKEAMYWLILHCTVVGNLYGNCTADSRAASLPIINYVTAT